MRLDMELEFDKYCVVDGSPTTVLPSPRCRSKVEKRNSKSFSRCGNDVLNLNADFTEISFHRYRSASCKNTSSRTVPLEYNELQKRESVYQSSKEVRLMRKTDVLEGRKKIEFSQSSAAALSLGLLDSLCSSDEENPQAEQKRSSMMSRISDLSTATTSKSHVELHSHNFLDVSFRPFRRKGVPSDGISESSFDSDNGENQCAENAERQSVQDLKITSKPVIVPLSDGNTLLERDSVVSLHKSLSAKLALPHSAARSESDSSRAGSPKSRFGPVRKVFDPFVKSKSQKSPLSSLSEQRREAPTETSSIGNKTFRKSLLHDFSNTGQHMDCEPCSAKEHHSFVQSSPAHLHGLLKLENKHGVPFFEFSVKFPEDVFVAKTWKVENSLDWIYTFHTAQERRKSNASGRGSKENKVSLVVGQMQVSCYLCTELKDAGAFDDSMVTEFKLYDVAYSRKSVSSQDNSCCSADIAKALKASDENSLQGSCKVDEVSVKSRVKGQPRIARNSGYFGSSTSYPLTAADLHAHLESAAIIIQLPFEKRESLKFKSGDKKIYESLQNFLDPSEIEKELIPNFSRPAKVNVIIPSGNHSLPTTESPGPSPLLDRWRLGGGCDCGGWDMACPLNIFGNPDIPIAADHLMENKRPLEIFIQGRKDHAPALTMTRISDEQYAVDFHAQFSSLQAFSICIAVLHTTEAYIDVRHEPNKQLLQRSSQKVFTQEEVKSLTDTVIDEEKHKAKKKMEEILPSFIVNPPFSPIARV